MSEQHELSDYLEDILTALSDVEEFTRGMDFEAFSDDRKTIFAVIRCLEIVGEATKRIPMSFRVKYSDVPWSKMAGMRDVLIHDYMGVDLKVVWKVVQVRLPVLKSVMERIIQENRIA
jgi:uncharacterized protein with HEPN domain